MFGVINPYDEIAMRLLFFLFEERKLCRAVDHCSSSVSHFRYILLNFTISGMFYAVSLKVQHASLIRGLCKFVSKFFLLLYLK